MSDYSVSLLIEMQKTKRCISRMIKRIEKKNRWLKKLEKNLNKIKVNCGTCNNLKLYNFRDVGVFRQVFRCKMNRSTFVDSNKTCAYDCDLYSQKQIK